MPAWWKFDLTLTPGFPNWPFFFPWPLATLFPSFVSFVLPFPSLGYFRSPPNDCHSRVAEDGVEKEFRRLRTVAVGVNLCPSLPSFLSTCTYDRPFPPRVTGLLVWPIFSQGYFSYALTENFVRLSPQVSLIDLFSSPNLWQPSSPLFLFFFCFAVSLPWLFLILK
jgi:hypothetical protein